MATPAPARAAATTSDLIAFISRLLVSFPRPGHQDIAEPPRRDDRRATTGQRIRRRSVDRGRWISSAGGNRPEPVELRLQPRTGGLLRAAGALHLVWSISACATAWAAPRGRRAAGAPQVREGSSCRVGPRHA